MMPEHVMLTTGVAYAWPGCAGAEWRPMAYACSAAAHPASARHVTCHVRPPVAPQRLVMKADLVHA